MNATPWINETLYPEWQQRFKMKTELVRVNSAYQEIVIFDSYSHGRLLMLDGAIQMNEYGFAYMEMMIHVPMLAHGAVENVLIIGAGDGGTLRQVLLYHTVHHVVAVDIDEAVMRLSKEFMPALAGDAWDDPRTEVFTGDGIDYVRRTPDAAFDIIVIDSSDPVGATEVLFSTDFYQHCARILKPGGIMVNQCGVPLMQGKELHESTQRRRKFFAHVTAYVVAEPAYIGGFMTLGWSAKDPSLATIPVEVIRERAAQAGILGVTKYWTPEIHTGAFNLPPYIARHMPLCNESDTSKT